MAARRCAGQCLVTRGLEEHVQNAAMRSCFVRWYLVGVGATPLTQALVIRPTLHIQQPVTKISPFNVTEC